MEIGALDFEVVVYVVFVVFFDEIEAACVEFSLTSALPVGRFSADVTLVDAADFGVTFSQILDDLLILVASEPLFHGAGFARLSGRAAEAGAVAAFCLHAWPRIRAASAQKRER